MPTPLLHRRAEVDRTRARLERLHSPRLLMALIVALTGATGFLASFVLLHTGMESLRLRYPLAVGIAYLAFLGLLWGWLRFRTRRLLEHWDFADPGPLDASSSPSSAVEGIDPPGVDFGGGGEFSGGGASGAFDGGSTAEVVTVAPPLPSGGEAGGSGLGSVADLVDIGDLEAVPLVVILAMLAAVVASLFAALSIVWGAPSFLAELVVDTALAGGLYRRLKAVEPGNWLATALWRTWWMFAGVALLVWIAGALMQFVAPEASTLREVLGRSPEQP